MPNVSVAVNVPTPLRSTTGAASSPSHAACSASLTATGVSILPVVNSSFQLPPFDAAPVGSSLAATSAPVRSAMASTRRWPSLVAAKSQP